MKPVDANHWLASQDAAGVVVTRHFATLGQRQLHYRRAGSGPPVLLLHQTPTSSAELLPLLRQIALRCTALAPDMPGYGASDPLPDTPLTVTALADNVASFMDELGIETAAVYGYHTGASVANCLARRHPRRVIVTLTLARALKATQDGFGSDQAFHPHFSSILELSIQIAKNACSTAMSSDAVAQKLNGP